MRPVTCLLVRLVDEQRMSGVIVETEAYTGHDDLASYGRLRKRMLSANWLNNPLLF